MSSTQIIPILLTAIVTIGIAITGLLGTIWWKLAQLEKSQHHSDEDVKVLKSELKDIQKTLTKLDTIINYKTQNEK